MPISNTYLDQIDWDQLTNDPFVASWNRAKRKQSQRQMTHEDRTETNRRVRDAMKTMQESIVPQSPAELAAMFALGPVGGKAFKGAMLASGALASDDAEAAVYKLPFEKLKDIITRAYRFNRGEADEIIDELYRLRKSIHPGANEAGFSRETTKSGFESSYPSETYLPIKATKDALTYANRARSPLLDRIFDAHTHPNNEPVFSFADLSTYMREPKNAKTNFTVISPEDKYSSFAYHKNSYFPYKDDSNSLINLEDLAKNAGVDFKDISDPGYEDWLNSTAQDLALTAMMQQADKSKYVDMYYDWPIDLEERILSLRNKIYGSK